MLIACVFLTGLAYQRYSEKLFAGVCLLLVLQEIRIGRKTKKIQKAAGRSILLLSAFLLGIFHMQKEENFRNAYMSKMTDGSRITVWGECIKTEITEYGNRGFLSNCYIRLNKDVIPCNDIVVYTSCDQFQIGQIHKVNGKVNMFSRARNEGNFDSYLYYQSLKIDFSVDAKDIVIIAEEERPWRAIILSYKEKIRQVYTRSFEKKTAGFYQAMVLGDKTDLDESLKKLFLVGGISHILAISGLHVSIIGRGLYRGLRTHGIGFAMAGICGSIMLILYCLMVGSSTSTIRATGMLMVYFLSQFMGRSYDMLNALGGMVIFLLLDNPFLIENSGFWFSVTALLGVGVIGRELSSEGKEKKGLQPRFSALWMSIGITLTTLPITALSYYEVPIYSPFVNFIVLPLLTPFFVLAVIGGVLGVWFPTFAEVLLSPCQWLLGFYEWVCTVVEKFPGASVICGKPQWWQVGLYYAVLFLGVWGLETLSKEKTVKGTRLPKYNMLRGGLLIICGLVILLPKSKPPEITFLDVGQGDGIYISSGDGSAFFIDGGSSNVSGVGEYRILPFLKSKGVKEIDYWFVSHTDSDHISGLCEILHEGYKIENIILGERCSNDDKYRDLLSLAENAGIKIVHMNEGDSICTRNMKITCLGPLTVNNEAIGKDKNENSLVLFVEYRFESETYRSLFAGDISSEMEEKLCEAGVVEDVDLFKANHHGSNYSNSELLLATICPENIVISCSESNVYGHPGSKAIERMEACGAQIFYTMENGQITFPLIQ